MKQDRKVSAGKIKGGKIRVDAAKKKEKQLQLEELRESRVIIGERIRNIRESYGLERVNLSHQLGLSPNLVGQYERGVSSPQPLTIVKIAEKFNTTTDYLLGKTDDPSPSTENELTLDTLLNKVWVYKGVELTEEEKRKLYAMIETGLDLLNK